jgi:hypothetical protein
MKTLPTICCTLLLAGGLAGTPTVAFAQEGTYERVVLIEEMTSVTCIPCAAVSPIMNSAVEEGNGKVVSIRYHLNIPYVGDPYYNSAEIDGRNNYYLQGASNTAPRMYIDGKASQKDYIKSDANDRKSVKSPINIEVTQTPYGNEYNVSVKITAGPDGLSGDQDYRLRIIALEGLLIREDWKASPPKNIISYNGEVEFHDIMRKLVNSADGEAITLMANESKTFTATYTRGADWQANQMYTVAFVQNDDNGEVIQTGYSPKSTSGIAEQTSVRGFSFSSVVPNPANNTAVLSYTLGSAASVAIEVRSILGQQVMRLEEGAMEAGSHRKGIDLSTLTAGSYIVTLRAGDYVASEQLAVVK